MVRFVIEGPPMTKAAPKHYIFYNIVNGKRLPQVRSYNPQQEEMDNVKSLLIIQLQSKLNSENKEIQLEASELAHNRFFDLSIHAQLPIPESIPNSTRNKISWGLIHPSNKDCDNIAKFYLDCIKHTIIPNDNLILSLFVKKLHSKFPQTIIEIFPKKQRFNKSIEDFMSIFSYEDVTDFRMFAMNVLGMFNPSAEEFKKELDCLLEKQGANLIKYSRKLCKEKSNG